jgi:hypothetical protein
MLGVALAVAVAVTLPPGNVPADYQLGGAYPPDPSVGVVVRDWREDPAPGTYGICYVNGFQTQPEQRRWWLRRHPDLVLRDAGAVVGDPDWPGEVLLDTRTAVRRARIAQIVGRWIAACARSGYQGVEADNLDSWSRSRGLLTRGDNAALARRLAKRAHNVGLAFGQKNAASLTGLPFFDFAVTEQCQRYRECARFLDRYGDAVIEIEYRRRDFESACADRGDRIAVIWRDRLLRPAGQPRHRFATC